VHKKLLTWISLGAQLFLYTKASQGEQLVYVELENYEVFKTKMATWQFDSTTDGCLQIGKG
jgi:hypothetical protein